MLVRTQKVFSFWLILISQEQLVIDIYKFRDACILLCGDRPYREYPLGWTVQTLKNTGFEVKGVGMFETHISKGFLLTQIRVAERKVKRLRDQSLAEVMQAKVIKFRNLVESEKWGIEFGNDYVIVADLISDHSHSHKNSNMEITDVLPKNYKSAVEEQKVVFPIDDN